MAGVIAASLLVGLLQQGLTATWTQFDATPAEAQALTYRIYLDALPSIILQGVTCQTVVNQTECSAPLPTPSNGDHVAQLTAANAAGESDKSDPVSFRYPGKPTKPVNVAIVRLGG